MDAIELHCAHLLLTAFIGKHHLPRELDRTGAAVSQANPPWTLPRQKPGIENESALTRYENGVHGSTIFSSGVRGCQNVELMLSKCSASTRLSDSRTAVSGVALERIRLKRDLSPVVCAPGLVPLPLPDELRGGSGVILYSGNWGVAHDDHTFIEAYAEYLQQSKPGLRFWLNATSEG